MLIVRDVFIAKAGMASKLAKLMKDVWAKEPGYKVRLLTDAVGDYNTVVLETELPDLAALDKRMQMYNEREDLRKKMAGYTDLYLQGRREVLRVVD
jgi:hypothetical protein